MSKADVSESLAPPAMGVSGSRFRAASIATQRVHYVDDGLVMAEVDRVCVAVWRTEPTEFLFDRQESALCDVISRHNVPVGFLCVVEAKVPPPSEKVRKASVEMLTSRKQHLACVAGVIADTGFAAAITRSVLSGMSFLLSSRDFHVTFTDTVPHAAKWMSSYMTFSSVPFFCDAVDSYRMLLVKDA
jgi:hypothetical protein